MGKDPYFQPRHSQGCVARLYCQNLDTFLMNSMHPVNYFFKPIKRSRKHKHTLNEEPGSEHSEIRLRVNVSVLEVIRAGTDVFDMCSAYAEKHAPFFT